MSLLFYMSLSISNHPLFCRVSLGAQHDRRNQPLRDAADLASLDGSHTNISGLSLDQRHLLPFPLLGKHPSAHSENALEPLLALSSVLPEALDERILNAVLDLLPPTAQRGDLGRLLELCLVIVEGAVDDGFLHVEEVAPGDVGRDHGDRLLAGVDV